MCRVQTCCAGHECGAIDLDAWCERSYASSSLADHECALTSSVLKIAHRRHEFPGAFAFGGSALYPSQCVQWVVPVPDSSCLPRSAQLVGGYQKDLTSYERDSCTIEVWPMGVQQPSGWPRFLRTPAAPTDHGSPMGSRLRTIREMR